jgi:hypothetical protein
MDSFESLKQGEKDVIFISVEIFMTVHINIVVSWVMAPFNRAG